jgi:hypothetical protein
MNWYEEPGSALEGTFICNDDGCHNNEREDRIMSGVRV